MTSASRFTGPLLKPRYSLVDLALTVVVIAALLGVLAWYGMKAYKEQLDAAAFQNAMPDVKVAQEEHVADSRAYQREYDFTANWFTWNIPVWEKVLAPYKGKPDVHYLEIGLYEGRSAIWVLENILTHPTARLTGVDVFDGPYKEKFFANVERSGSKDKVKAIAGYSQVALRGLPLNSFDIIYVDGSHSKDDVLEDAVLSWRLLKEGGVIIFDDYRWAGFFAIGTADKPTDFPKAAIDRFVECFDNKLDVIHNSHQLIVRKKTTESK